MEEKTITVNEARKVLGKLANTLTDDEIKSELKMANFLADIVLKEYPLLKKSFKISKSN